MRVIKFYSAGHVITIVNYNSKIFIVQATDGFLSDHWNSAPFLVLIRTYRGQLWKGKKDKNSEEKISGNFLNFELFLNYLTYVWVWLSKLIGVPSDPSVSVGPSHGESP